MRCVQHIQRSSSRAPAIASGRSLARVHRLPSTSGIARRSSHRVQAADPMSAPSPIQRLDIGPRLSEAVIHNKTVYLGGQVPDDTSKDIKGQTAEVLGMIDDLLARAGTDKSRILFCQIFLVDLNDFPGMNEVWDAWVVPGATPARATVQIPKLADPGWKLEIVVTAALP